MTAGAREDQAQLHGGVHQQLSFVCGSGLPGCVVTFCEKPERSIGGALLEDVTDWMQALQRLEHRRVPQGVLDAASALHEALANWVDLMDRDAARAEVAERLRPYRRGPDGAA